MAKAIADPHEIRRFAGELKRFSSNLQEELISIHRQFKRLGETWRDQEHAKFSEAFEQTLHALNKFVDASEKHVPFLMRKAEAIQNYLDQS